VSWRLAAQIARIAGEATVVTLADGAKPAWSNAISAMAFYAKFTEELFSHSCTACRLFGSPWLASRVYFQDAMLINGDDLLRLTEVRDGVGIDRDLGSAKRGIKFDFEVVPTKAKFGVRIIAENMEDWEMGLFLLSLRAMEEGELPLGGKTTRGLGWCQLQGLKVERITSADLLSYLQGNSPSEADPQNFVRVFLQGLSQGGDSDA
jgi:CRISPR-associated RAMP protein (TIGR02581 family)